MTNRQYTSVTRPPLHTIKSVTLERASTISSPTFRFSRRPPASATPICSKPIRSCAPAPAGTWSCRWPRSMYIACQCASRSASVSKSACGACSRYLPAWQLLARARPVPQGRIYECKAHEIYNTKPTKFIIQTPRPVPRSMSCTSLAAASL